MWKRKVKAVNVVAVICLSVIFFGGLVAADVTVKKRSGTKASWYEKVFDTQTQDGNGNTVSSPNSADRVTYRVSNSAEVGMTVTTNYIGIEIANSDYPHSDTLGSIVITDLDINVAMESQKGLWKVKLGLVETQNGATSAKIGWFWEKYVGSQMASKDAALPNDPIPLLRKPFCKPLNLELSGNTLGTKTITGSRDAANTSFGNDDALVNFLSAAGYAAVRDVVVTFEEITDGGTIKSFSAEVGYYTIPARQ